MVADGSDPTAPNLCLLPLAYVVKRGQSRSPVVGVLFPRGSPGTLGSIQKAQNS